ncbi:biopolymer transporter ExbD [Candidatus Dependentiae bacterium]|nr:biopolymer transporter ExbD [Candidatus Dependentiae bacterium]MCC7415324.1 biopolymer transporter ExbD [Campylobacterota bacterium]
MVRTGRRRARKTIAEISLTPLIDTALTLLIIFMVTAPIMNNSIRVTLPKGQSREDAGAKQEMIVTIDKQGSLFFNGQSVPARDELIILIKKQAAGDADSTVFVQADETVSYGKVLELVDNIKVVGGISYVALATKQS